MEAVGIFYVDDKESLASTIIPVEEIQLSVVVPTFEGQTFDIIYLTESGLLIHCFNGRLVRCLNLKHSYPGNGKVTKLDLFYPSSGSRCICVYHERVCLIFEIGHENGNKFLLRHQVEMTSTKIRDIEVYDFLRKGTQQLHLKDENLKEKYLLIEPGGITCEIDPNEKGPLTLNSAISKSVLNVRRRIPKVKEDSEHLDQLVRSAILHLSGSAQTNCHESKLAQQLFGAKNISSASKFEEGTTLPSIAEPPRLHVASKLMRHSGKVVAIFKVVNQGQSDVTHLNVFPDLCSDEPVAVRIDFSGTASRLSSRKSRKVIVQFNEAYSRLMWADPICQLSLECIDTASETEIRHRLPAMSLVQDPSQSEFSNNLRDKFLALKKIFLRKCLVIRTVFTNVQSFLDVCRLKLNFQFVDDVNIFSRSEDENVFFGFKPVKVDEKHISELELYGKDEECLKSFLQSVYFHAPQDLIITPRKSTEPTFLSRADRYVQARAKLGQEISSLLKCFEGASQDNIEKVSSHVEGTKSVYESKRNFFKARSLPILKVTRHSYCLARRNAIDKEIESDFALYS